MHDRVYTCSTTHKMSLGIILCFVRCLTSCTPVITIIIFHEPQTCECDTLHTPVKDLQQGGKPLNHILCVESVGFSPHLQPLFTVYISGLTMTHRQHSVCLILSVTLTFPQIRCLHLLFLLYLLVNGGSSPFFFLNLET
jgi:hypothetical protein